MPLDSGLKKNAERGYLKMTTKGMKINNMDIKKIDIKKIDIKKILSILVLIVILIVFGGIHLLVNNIGESLYLETIPYDPVDLFRGDYVNLEYEIENLDLALVDKTMYEKETDGDYKYFKILDDNGYLIYKEGSNPLQVVALVADKPAESNYLKAKLYYIDEFDNKARLEINLSRFYVPEGTGTELEDLSRQGRLVVEIKKLGPFYTLKGISKIIPE